MIEDKSTTQIEWNLENSYAALPNTFYSSVKPVPVRSPSLVILNNTLARFLGLNHTALQGNEGIAVLAGNQLPEEALPIAQAYAGHQFGHFTMLGDGRAMLIGEQITPLGERFDIQLKGSGKTPYSRGGDGRATLGPMLREYIISEAMYALRIPTTRSLAVVSTGESVYRETELPGAILTRVAASHIRVGTFQYVSKWGSAKDIKTLADYTIQRHFLALEAANNPYLSLLQEVIKRQAELIVKWQLVGFIHGVMNTDNMAISGESIDYGPCAFMDIYDTETVFSSIDVQGRYAYGNQPRIAAWNLARFADTLLPLIHESQEEAIVLAQDALSQFSVLFYNNWMNGMRAKLGISNEETEDKTLIAQLLDMMQNHQADYNNTFRALTFNKLDNKNLFGSEEFKQWHKLWQKRLCRQHGVDTHQLMRSVNPAIIPRNHRVEAALEAAVKRGDYSVMKGLLDVLSEPYAHSPEQNEYSELPAASNCPYRTFCGT